MPAGILYVVATPLGNLGDLSPRAAETLRTVDIVAAEDTRRTLGLLNAIEARPRLVSYHAHSDASRADTLIESLQEGRSIALVTDAGTPAISDPGSALVASARTAGIRVVPIPGPSAVATALSAAGLVGDRYLFLGFLPRKGEARRAMLERMASEPWTVVCFEAANRLDDLLIDLIELCGAERHAVVARELTKVFEELRDGTLADLLAYYKEVPPLGEVTLVLAGRPESDGGMAEMDTVEVNAAIVERLAAGDSRKDVVRMVSARFGVARNEAYRLVMEQV